MLVLSKAASVRGTLLRIKRDRCVSQPADSFFFNGIAIVPYDSHLRRRPGFFLAIHFVLLRRSIRPSCRLHGSVVPQRDMFSHRSIPRHYSIQNSSPLQKSILVQLVGNKCLFRTRGVPKGNTVKAKSGWELLFCTSSWPQHSLLSEQGDPVGALPCS